MHCVSQFIAKGALRDIQLDDVGDFQLTDQAMTHMGLSESEKLAIYGIVAGVLHLGNLMFNDDPATKGWLVSACNIQLYIIIVIIFLSDSGVSSNAEPISKAFDIMIFTAKPDTACGYTLSQHFVLSFFLSHMPSIVLLLNPRFKMLSSRYMFRKSKLTY